MKIAIIGLGVVGRGAYEIVEDELAPEIQVKYVMDLRPLEGIHCAQVKDIADITSDPEVDVVIESIGGLHPAYEFITASLKAGKSVVTANKYLISTYYKELHLLAQEHGVLLQYTPSAGGGIPWLYNINRTRRCGPINFFSGIINGTTNYILDSMTRTGAEFNATLKKAQELGYAEADPSADIDGLDVQRKCAISANRAFDAAISTADIPTAGIRYITDRDIAAFQAKGVVCRLICRGEAKDGKVSAYVEPTLFSPRTLEANVPDNFNLMTLDGAYVGRLSFYGQGAGRYPTAHSMVEDVVDIYVKRAYPAKLEGAVETVDNSAISHRYYVRGDDLSFLGDIKTEKMGDGVLTAPVAVDEMHRLVKGELARGAAVFFAGLNEE